MNLPKMLTIKEASKQTKLPDYYLRVLCIKNKIKHIKSGKKYYINEDSLRDFLNNTSDDLYLSKE